MPGLPDESVPDDDRMGEQEPPTLPLQNTRADKAHGVSVADVEQVEDQETPGPLNAPMETTDSVNKA
eukprot:1325746-Amphidinium_carterae.1